MGIFYGEKAIVIVIYIRNVFIVQKLKVLHRLKGKHEKRYIQADKDREDGWVVEFCHFHP